MGRWTWKQLDYQVHRWIGLTLGILVLVWFVSGIVMLYYPWPAPTPREALGRLAPLAMPARAIGAESAAAVAARGGGGQLSGARVEMMNGRAVYVLLRARGGGEIPVAVVDAANGALISPLSAPDAEGIARGVVGAVPRLADRALMDAGDHYLLSSEYQHGFPAYRLRFDDAAHTAVYVSRAGGHVIGVVNDRTRWTTWLGTVPHWLYFKWLYTRHFPWWLWASYLLPAFAMMGGITGIVFGLVQLFPRRARGDWRATAFRGMSQWHHLAGLLFGVLVLTWSLSGLLEVLGPDGSPSEAQVMRARGGSGMSARIGVAQALALAIGARPPARDPVAVDVTSLDGRPGYVVRWAADSASWIDAVTGASRGELDSAEATRLARLTLGAPAPVTQVTRLTGSDSYYYSRRHRDVALPVWRVAFADADRSTLYLDAVSGRPVGFVDRETRWYRWLRDGLHSLDFRALLSRDGWWETVMLVLLASGTVIAFTGVWLVVRRLYRWSRPRPPA